AGMRQMDARMDIERSLLETAFAFQHLAVAIQGEKVGGGHLAPVQTVSVVEKFSARHHEAEMVANPLVQVHAEREAERSGEVGAGNALNCRNRLELLHGSHGTDYSVGS